MGSQVGFLTTGKALGLLQMDILKKKLDDVQI